MSIDKTGQPQQVSGETLQPHTAEQDNEHPISKAIYWILLLLMVVMGVVIGLLGYYVHTTG